MNCTHKMRVFRKGEWEMSQRSAVVGIFLGGVLGSVCVAGPVVINEFMASNSSVAKDPQGQYDDWI